MLITYTPSQREYRDGSPWRLPVTWVRLDQEFDEHRKVASVGHVGLALQVRALCYCNRNLTDGFVSTSVIKRLTGDMDLGADAMTILMVGAGLWDPAEGGISVHDFLDYNPSREMVETVRRQRTEAGRRGGLAKSWQSASKVLSKTLAKSCPDPDPVRERDQLVVTPTIQSDPRASRSTRRRFKSKKPGSFGRL